MNKNTGIIIGIMALVVILGGVYASMNTRDSVVEQNKMPEGKMMMDEKVVENNNMMRGSYEMYSPEKVTRAESGDVVLFFHASWCPSCRNLNSDIEANLNAIPEGVSILKIDYDTETELKKKYGVTYQHTLVQVDKDGVLLKKWSGSPKLSNIISEIQ